MKGKQKHYQNYFEKLLQIVFTLTFSATTYKVLEQNGVSWVLYLGLATMAKLIIKKNIYVWPGPKLLTDRKLIYLALINRKSRISYKLNVGSDLKLKGSSSITSALDLGSLRLSPPPLQEFS